jgi:UDP-N-acetylmuramoyl-L-alanyl-D-glutamate--2,6-diaminopimelate ligase
MAAERQPGIRLADLVTEIAVPGPSAGLRVSGLALDSRAVRPGDLFLALRGQRHDGRDFLAAAAAAGAVAALVDAATPGAPLPVFEVAELAQRISAIAGRFYGEPSRALAVTGITGTNGKTTCCQLLAQLFTALEAPAGVIGTLGAGLLGAAPQDTGFTTPDAVATQRLLAELRAAGARRVAMEVSSHSLAQGRVAAVRFHTALFTNLSRDHLDYHAGMDAYRDAKARLFRQPGLQVAVVNLDDPAGRTIAAELPAHVRRLGYSAQGRGAELRVVRADFGAAGIRARIATPWGTGELSSPLPGAFNLANLLAVIAAACGQGFALDAVLAAVPRLRAAPGRMQEVGGGRPRVIVDYAHTPDALAQALAALRPATEGRLWCVFGCGGERDRGKRPQMGAVAARGADVLVLTSDNPRGEDPQGILAEILAGLSAPQRATVAVMADRRRAIEHAIAAAAAEDCVLIAGKGHETWQEIHGVRWPFDDAAVARAALAARGEAP